MTVHLEPGRFYAGVSLPFFVTHAMVQHKLEGLGFTNVSFHPRDQSAQLAVNPRKYPAYDDSWDEWIEADYAGPKKDLPVDKHWSWLLVVPKSSAPTPPSSGAPPQGPVDPAPGIKAGLSSSTIAVGVFALGLGFLWLKRHA